MKKKIKYSFEPGVQQVAKADFQRINKELMKLLGITSPQYYCRKRKSYMNMPTDLQKSIEKVFKKYGIKRELIWKIENLSSPS